MNRRDAGRRTALAVAGFWVVATAIFYFIRFSLVFYHANETAIRSLLTELTQK